MEEIFIYIENSDDCQLTLNELSNVCKTTTLDYRTIKLRLKLKYGEKLIITEKSGALTFICLVDNHNYILNQAWKQKKKTNESNRRTIQSPRRSCSYYLRRLIIKLFYDQQFLFEIFL